MMHLGPRPTFDEETRSLEVHLFAAVRELRGSDVKVSWVRRLRDIMSFGSADALKEQLGRDRDAALAALAVPPEAAKG